MRKIISLLLLLTLGIYSAVAPMPEAEAQLRFKEIRQSEYRWVLAQWRSEMQIKTRSRTSTRSSSWNNPRTTDPLRTLTGNQYKAPTPVDPITLPNP